MERIKNIVGKNGFAINRSLGKLFGKQKQNGESVDNSWMENISGLPSSAEVRFNGDERIEYRLGQYSYANVFRHPDAMYSVMEPELTPDEEEIIQNLKNRMLKTVLATNDEELEKEIRKLMKKLAIDVHEPSKNRIIYYLLRDFTGYGIIDPINNDANVEDISCNGIGVPIYVQHRYLGSVRTNLSFEDENTLDNFVSKLAMRCGKSVSVAKPILDAGMPDGNRVNLTFGREVTPKGSTFTIRKFKTHVISLVE